MIEKLIEKKSNVNIINKFRKTALHVVMESKLNEDVMDDLVNLLISNKCKLDLKDSECKKKKIFFFISIFFLFLALNPLALGLSQTPINWKPIISILKALPDSEISVKSSPVNVLSRATTSNSKTELDFENPTHEDGEFGKTCLQLALNEKKKEAVLLAIQKGAFVNESKLTQNSNVLIVAAENNWDDVVELAVKRMVDPTTRNSDGLTALHFACKNNNQKIVDMILNKKTSTIWIDDYINIDDNKKFYEYFQFPRVESFLKIIESIPKEKGYNLISSAFLKNDTELLKLLVENNALTLSWKQRPTKDASLMMLAVDNNQILDIILEKDKEMKNKKSNFIAYDPNALAVAIEKKKYDSFLKLWGHQSSLKEHKVFLERKDQNGKSLISTFFEEFPEGKEKTEIFKYISQKSKQDADGNSAIHFLAKDGILKGVEAILNDQPKIIWQNFKNKMGTNGNFF